MKKIKALLVNGSPHPDGVCGWAMGLVKDKLEALDVECTLVNLASKDVRGCIACGYCKTHGQCVFHDIVNESASLLEEADILIAASPTYYAGANATLLAYLTRLFYSTPFSKAMKVGGAVASARRAGTLVTFDEINHFFTISQMPVVSSSYWNNTFGNNAQQAMQDTEAKAVMEQLAVNAAFLARSIQLGKEQLGQPEQVAKQGFNYIR